MNPAPLHSTYVNLWKLLNSLGDNKAALVETDLDALV